MMPDGYAACATASDILYCTSVLLNCPHDHMFTVRQDKMWLDKLSDLALECLQEAQTPGAKFILGHPE